MTTKDELIRQTNLAFDFIQKLYTEVSYLIKEVEGLLYEEKEKFVICRPSGYGITARSSTGLESVGVNMWLLRKLTVAFIPETQTKREQGQTVTEINEKLRVLYLKIILDDKNIEQPQIYSGILYDIHKNPQGAKSIKKFENLMGHIEYNDQKIFHNPNNIVYEDTKIKYKGEFISNNLYDLNDSNTLYQKVIVPSLDLFRKWLV